MTSPWDWAEVPDVVAAVEAATLGAAGSCDPRRGHLGASQIGVECERRLWWEFRHGGREPKSFRGPTAAKRGGLMEQVFEEELQRAGLRPAAGRTYAALGAHFGGTADAVVTVPERLAAAFGLPAGTKIIVDYKDMNHARFLALRRQGPRLFEAGRYWAQVQTYVHFARESGHLPECAWGALYCADKDREDRALYLFPFIPAAAGVLLEKARRVITSAPPPPRGETRAEALACKFCPAADWCWRGAPLAVNCRTCCHAAPVAVTDQVFLSFEKPAKYQAPGAAWCCNIDREKGPCAAHVPADFIS